MLREKSCGVVPFREEDGEIRYLVISSAVTKREHWEFPKGGVEEGEREIETALRELQEETGVTDVELLPGYREPIRYIYRRAEGLIFKQVIYFIGRVKDPTITPRVEEVKDYRWATFDEARVLLRHGNARELLFRSHAFITGQPLPPRRPNKKGRPPRRPSAGRPEERDAAREDAGSASEKGARRSRPRQQRSVDGERSSARLPAEGVKRAEHSSQQVGASASPPRAPAEGAPSGESARPRRSRRRRRRRRKPPSSG